MSTTELGVIIAISVVAALLKSVVGLGYPLLLVPALALFLPIADAIVIVAPSNLVLNLQIAWVNRSSASGARTIRPFVVLGVAGAIVGTILLPFLPDRGLRVILIAIIVGFLVSRTRRGGNVDSSGSPDTDRFAAPVGFLAGIFQGAAGISGPVVSAWFLSRQIAVDAFVFAVTLTFAVTGAAQLVVLLFQPEFASDLALGLVLIPFALAMVPVGGFIRARMDTSRFESLVIAVLIAAALSLIARVL